MTSLAPFIVAMALQSSTAPLEKILELPPDAGPPPTSGCCHPMTYYGQSVAVDGDVIVIGSQYEEDLGQASGAAYVYMRVGSTWVRQQKLLANDGAAGDLFGDSVAASGDTIAVGAIFTDDNGANSGSVYVFVRSGATWELQQELFASDAAAGDRFGDAVALDGNRLVIGAPSAGGAGAAYVFARTGSIWTEQQRLVADDIASNDRFGKGVAIDGDTLVVGAPAQDNGNASTSYNAGAAYAFAWSGASWNQQGKLVGSDVGFEDETGEFVDVDGDRIVVGAYRHGGALGHDGSLGHVFLRSGTSWAQEAELLIPAEYNDLPQSIAISGERVAAGAFTSKAYLLDHVDGSWVLSGTTAAEAFADPTAVALDERTLVVGLEDSDQHNDPGTAFVHSVAGHASLVSTPDVQVAATAWNPASGRYFSHLFVPSSGTRLAVVPAGADPVRSAGSVGDLNFNGSDDLALLSVAAAGAVTARVKDGISGELISAVSFEAAFRPQAMQIVPDVTGDFDAAPELAVLGIDSDGFVRVQTKDALSGALVSKVNFDRAFTPMALLVSDDLNGSGFPELVVLGIDASGRVRAQIKDVVSGQLVGFVWFDRNYRPSQVTGVDTDGSGLPDALAVLGESSSGVVRAQVKALSSGTRLGLVRFESGFDAIDLVAVDDVNSSGGPELALLQRRPDGSVRVQVKDALTGSPVSIVPFAAGYTPLALGVSKDLAGNLKPDLVFLGESGGGSLLLQVKDALSGDLVSRTEFE